MTIIFSALSRIKNVNKCKKKIVFITNNGIVTANTIKYILFLFSNRVQTDNHTDLKYFFLYIYLVYYLELVPSTFQYYYCS